MFTQIAKSCETGRSPCGFCSGTYFHATDTLAAVLRSSTMTEPPQETEK